MGIRGLSSYVTACQRSCSEHVELGILEDSDGSSQPQAGGVVQRLAVDGLALVYHVMKNTKDRRLYLELGCDYETLAAALLDYLSALTNAGITPVVIVDGMQDTEKSATTVLRRRAQVEEASILMERIGEIGVSECTASGSGPIFRYANRLSLLPLFAAETLAAACQAAGVAFRVADREADPELAAACRSYPRPSDENSVNGTKVLPVGRGSEVGDERWIGGCDAVLSNDSDFLVMDIPGYIPFWALGLGGDGSAGALVFRRHKLAARLGIPADRLPDLACLIGNDWIQPGDRVHGIIMRDRAGSVPISTSKNQNTSRGEFKKRRKGSGGGTPSGTNSSAPSAKDLVEATARFLSRFYEQQRQHQEEAGAKASVKFRITSWTGEGKHLFQEDCKNNTELNRHRSNRREQPLQKCETTAHVRHATAPRQESIGAEEDEGAASDPLDASLCRRFFPHRPPSGGGNDVDTIEPLACGPTITTASTTTSSDRPVAVPRKKNVKRSGKGKGIKVKRGSSRCVAKTASFERVGGEEERGSGSGGGREDERGVDFGDSEIFLQKFRAAKRHFEIPATPRNRRREDCSNENLRRGGSAGECSAVTVGAEGISQARGLLTGLSVPPELVQAVLEGVFWCRVMLEDVSIREEKLSPTTRSQPHMQGCRDYTVLPVSPAMSPLPIEDPLPEDYSCITKPHSPTGQGADQELLASLLVEKSYTLFDSPFRDGNTGDHSPARADMLSRRDGSAFGSFSEVRIRLYELCLALQPDLAERPMIVGRRSSSMGQESNLGQKREISRNCRQERADESPRFKEEGCGIGLPVEETSSALKSRAALRQREHIRNEGEEGTSTDSEGGGEEVVGGVDASIRSQGPAEGGRNREVPTGDRQWVVNEMRCVGSNVKAVAVLCQVPPPLMLPTATLDVSSGGYMDMTRWKLLLSVLNLGDRDNCQLTALIMAEAGKSFVDDAARGVTQGRTGQRQKKNRKEGGERYYLAGIAVVAALLLSTSLPPVIATPQSSNSGGARLMCCSNEIALAFIVAATRCAHPPYSFPTAKVNPGSTSCGDFGRATSQRKETMPPTPTLSGCTADSYGCVCPYQTNGLDHPGTTSDKGTAPAPYGGRCSKGGQVRYGGDRRYADGTSGSGKTPLNEVRSRISHRGDTPETDNVPKTICQVCMGRVNGVKKTAVNDVTEVDGDVDRRFVSLWSHVQAAVWHTNACHSLLGFNFSDPATGSGKGNKRRNFALDPLLLRPVLALKYYRKRRRCLQRSRQHQSWGNSCDARQHEKQATLQAANIQLEQQEHVTPPHSYSCNHEDSSQILLMPGKERYRSKQQVQPTGNGGSLRLGNDNGSSDERIQECGVFTPSQGQQGWQQDELGCLERPPLELPTEEVFHCGVGQTCRGTCSWAQRVRTVMDAAGVVY